MKKPKIEELIMARLFAPRKDLDPSDWQTHVRRNLVQEVRAETIRFYGPTDCLEAQYPGLDYNKPAHRLRLSQYPYHRRLFRAFDLLQLSDSEIQRLCRWEGTRYAREAYEAQTMIKIRDTTWEGVADYRSKVTTLTRVTLRGGHIQPRDAALPDPTETQAGDEMEDSDGMEGAGEEESEDETQQSVGVELNQRLLAATEARARGEDVVLDPDWEQWLKEAAERGIHSDIIQLAQPTSAAAIISQGPVYSGRGMPAYNPTSEIAAVQTVLPPSTQYFLQESPNSLSATSTIPPSVPHSGTTSS